MKSIYFSVAAGLLIFTGCSSDSSSEAASPEVAAASELFNNLEDISQTPVSELEWAEAGFGPSVSPVVGNLGEGEHITLVRFPAGLRTDVHTHVSDYAGVMIEGVAHHFLPDDPAPVDLPAGSHWEVKGGEPHISECISDEDCVMVLYQADAFDFAPEG